MAAACPWASVPAMATITMATTATTAAMATVMASMATTKIAFAMTATGAPITPATVTTMKMAMVGLAWPIITPDTPTGKGITMTGQTVALRAGDCIVSTTRIISIGGTVADANRKGAACQPPLSFAV